MHKKSSDFVGGLNFNAVQTELLFKYSVFKFCDSKHVKSAGTGNIEKTVFAGKFFSPVSDDHGVKFKPLYKIGRNYDVLPGGNGVVFSTRYTLAFFLSFS